MEMAASMGASQCSSETVFVNDDFDHYLWWWFWSVFMMMILIIIYNDDFENFGEYDANW